MENFYRPSVAEVAANEVSVRVEALRRLQADNALAFWPMAADENDNDPNNPLNPIARLRIDSEGFVLGHYGNCLCGGKLRYRSFDELAEKMVATSVIEALGGWCC